MRLDPQNTLFAIVISAAKITISGDSNPKSNKIKPKKNKKK